VLFRSDYNATAPLCAAAREEWLKINDEFPGNPSSAHRIGDRADRILMEARERLGALLQCHPLDIVWTSGATESNNAAIYHLSERTGKDARLLVSSVEHPCVLNASARWFEGRLDRVPVLESGVVDLDALRSMIRDLRPCAVAVMAANNETGVLQPWRAVKELGVEYGVSSFVDAAQWLGKMPAKGLGDCDFVSGASHKFGGPKGVGFLKTPKSGLSSALLLGGKQERGFRAGTENPAGVMAMVAALEAREDAMRRKFNERAEAMTRRFEKELVNAVPGIRILGEDAERLWNTSMVLMPEVDCRVRWVVKLDREGFAVSSGSACSSGEEKASHVLSAMGIEPQDAGRAVRFSAGWDTPEADWDALLQATVSLCRSLMAGAEA